MRVAFVDLLFSWPPHGGADVDLYHVIERLQAEGAEVHLFFGATQSDERGIADPEALPFPATKLEFTRASFTPASVVQRFQTALQSWQPGIVWASHAFALKPHLLNGLADYTLVSRYYAHEMLCARDPRRFKDGAPCPNDYFNTPDICRACAAESQRDAIASGRPRAWTEEYLAAAAYAPGYHATALSGVKAAQVIVVSNETLAEEVRPWHDRVIVLPGGVEVARFDPSPPQPSAVKTILMAGRVDDPLKGLDTVRDALARLRESRQDFELVLTHHDHDLENDWTRCTGWLTFEETLAQYQAADLCVVPSIWHEPFGLVAVEAMAAARPVVASRIGGLRDIVVDGETGLHAAPGDAADWASKIAALLDDEALRARMGSAGRERAVKEYDWTAVIRKHYLPLLEELTG